MPRTAWHVHQEAGLPVARVRVRNLQGVLGASVGRDAWGRTGRPQPVLVSADVAFARPFAQAAQEDAVAADTVHYGTLSKAIRGVVEGTEKTEQTEQTEQKEQQELDQFVAGLWETLTGKTVDGKTKEENNNNGKALLGHDGIRSLELTVLLPKATRLGEGASLTINGLVSTDAASSSSSSPSPAVQTLQLHRLHVPVLIGVHPHERQAQQAVIADVAIEASAVSASASLVRLRPNVSADLEDLVVGELAASSFETLERLATHLAETILNKLQPWADKSQSQSQSWRVYIGLEKPIAVPFADAPVVELWMES